VGAKKSNKDKISDLERDVKRYKYLAEAKQRELNARKEEVKQIKAEARAGLEAAGMHITVLLGRLGEDSVFISHKDIKAAAKTKVYIKPSEEGFTIGVEKGAAK